MDYQRESVAAVFEEIKPLLALHWEEIAHYQDIPLDPDYDSYLALDKTGRIRVYTVRKEGVLIGYSVFFLGNLHYRSTKIASQDILFVLPEYRGGGVGFRFIRYCDTQLESEGVTVVYHHVKVKHDFGRLLVHLGYEPIDTIYGRRL